MEPQFDHERLDVSRVAIEFVRAVGELLNGPLAGCRMRAVGQLDRASTSIPLNIAEGNGKRTARDRCKYFVNARGSAFECAAALDVLVARKALEVGTIATGRALLYRIVGMLSKMCLKLIQQELPTNPATR